MLDVSCLVPQARSIVQTAATVYLQHTRPWFIGLLAHGSALKGGFIAGCSDIDLQLYLQNSAFTSANQLPLELSLAIQRDLAKIDPAPFRYIQCYALAALPKDRVGPIPGAYCLLEGRLPVAEATPQQLQDSARTALANLNPLPASIAGGLLEHGGGRLQERVRWLCTDVWPKLYQVLSLQQDDPIRMWGLPKESAIELLSPDTTLGRTIRTFYQAVRAYYPTEQSVEQALTVIERGIIFLQAVQAWWSETHTY